MRMQKSIPLLAFLAAALLTAAAPVLGQGNMPKIKASAVASKTAAVAGGDLKLLISLEIPDDVHIYWRSPGGTGLRTQIEWAGPDGVSFGRTQFPAPELKYDKTLKENSFVITGTAMFVTPVTIAQSVSGDALNLKATVSWLACRKGQCVPDGAELTVTLPVAASAKAANDEAFDEADWSLPVAASKAENAKISGKADAKALKPGAKFTATLVADIEKHHHMQSHKPLEDYLVPAIVFLEPTTGFEFGEVNYPKGKIRNDKMLGKLSEYAGKTEFKIPVTVTDEYDAQKSTAVRGVLQYQICNDSGTCFPPQAVEFAIGVGDGKGSKTAAMTGDNSPAAVAPTETDEAEKTTSEADQSSDGEKAAVTEDDSDEGWLARSQNYLISFGYSGVLVMAFIGGLILNLMPCVLPVISLKVLSFVKQAGEDRRRILALGLSYCTGIMVFFSVLAALYYYNSQGWGQLFQNPIVVLMLSAVVAAFALSLFGVFAVFTPKVINELGQKAEEREGLPSAFFTGLLATFLGTACTAPFLSAAVGAASKYPAFQGASIFMAVGVGMMFPFLLLSAQPAWLKFVPKPGKWMGTFEALMGFLLLGTVVWIIYPLPAQLGAIGLVLGLVFVLAVCMAAWIRGKAQFSPSGQRKWMLNGLSLVVIALGWLVPFQWLFTIDGLREKQKLKDEFYKKGVVTTIYENAKGGKLQWPIPGMAKDEIFWVPYEQELVKEFVAAGYTVFVDFTAEWCLSCKANKSVAIDVSSTRKLLDKNRIVTFKADYTNRDYELTKILRNHGRDGVPMYLMYDPYETEAPQILPEILTPPIMASAISSAGPSRPGTDQRSVGTASAQR